MSAAGTMRARIAPLAGPIALALLIAVAWWLYSDRYFGTPRMLMSLASAKSDVGLVAIGMTVVIISGGIDLAVGAIMTLCGVGLGVLIEDVGLPAWAAIGCVLVGGSAFGLLQGALINVTGLRPFVVTLAGMFAARGLGYVLRAESIGISDAGHAAFAAWGVPLPMGLSLPVTVCALLAVAAIAGWALTKTRTGRAVYALGGDEAAAVMMGVRARRVKLVVYAFSGLCAGLAGVVHTLYLPAIGHEDGVGLELDAIAAAVIGGAALSGGVGTVRGTLIGVAFLAILSALPSYQPGLTPGLIKLATGAVLLAFVLLERSLRAGRPATASG